MFTINEHPTSKCRNRYLSLHLSVLQFSLQILLQSAPNLAGVVLWTQGSEVSTVKFFDRAVNTQTVWLRF